MSDEKVILSATAVLDALTGELVIKPEDRALLCFISYSNGAEDVRYVSPDEMTIKIPTFSKDELSFLQPSTSNNIEVDNYLINECNNDKYDDAFVDGDQHDSGHGHEDNCGDVDDNNNQDNENEMDLEIELAKFVNKGKKKSADKRPNQLFPDDCDVENKENNVSKKVRSTWTPEMTLALIENYSKTKAKSNLKGDRFWMKISEIMHEQGYKVDGRICESKFDGLQRTYKGIIDKKKQTGTSPQKKWQFFDEMDLLLFKKPEIQPPAVASSLQGYKRKIAREIDENKSAESKPKKRTVTKERPMTLREVNDDANIRFQATLQRKDEFLDILRGFFSS